MLRHREHYLFDVGSLILAIGGAFALAIAGLQLIALVYVNSKWPSVPLPQIQREAVARSSLALSRIDGPNVLLQVQANAVQKWLQPEMQKSVDRINESQPELHLKVDTVNVSFEGQRGILDGAFELQLPKQDLIIKGSVEGLAYLTLDGTTLVVRPALSKLLIKKVSSESGKSWWLRPLANALFAELLLVRDNINGQLPTYTERLPIAPVTIPGEPRPPSSISFPDPFHAGATISEDFVPPVLKGAALLADGNSAIVLGQLSLTDVPAPGPGAASTDDFFVFRREFHSRLKASGLVANPASDVSFDIANSFVEDLFRRFMGQVFTRDRVSEAIQASFDSLPRVTHPDVGVSLDTPTVSKVVEQRVRSTLDAWASKHSGTIKSANFEVHQQYFWIGVSSTFDIPTAGAHLEATVAVAMPIAGTASGVRLYPAIDQLAVTKLRADSLGDLTGLLRGVNTFLASAIGAANAALQPVDVGLDPLTLGSIDFSSMASANVSVSPQSYTPPPLSFDNTAVLLDENRIMVMAEETPVASQAQAAPPSVDFDTYRKAYFARWLDPFGEPSRPGVAHAYIRTSAVAQYVNAAVREAHISLEASIPLNSTDTTPLEIGEIPSVQCKGLLHCPDCEWYDFPCLTRRAACEAINLPIQTACEVGLQPARLAINELTRILGRHLGDLTTDTHGVVNARATNIRLDIADDFASIKLMTTALGTASASADLNFDSKSVAGVLVCPLELGRFHHHVPFPSGEIHASIPPQELELDSTILTGLEPRAGGGQRFAILITPQNDIDIKGDLDTQPYLQLRLVMLSMSIQCPVTNVITALVPLLGPLLSLLDIGQISALVTDAVAQSVLNGLPPSLKALYLGKIERTIDKPGPLHLEVDIPEVHIGDNVLTLQPEIKDGLIQLHLISQ